MMNSVGVIILKCNLLCTYITHCYELMKYVTVMSNTLHLRVLLLQLSRQFLQHSFMYACNL